MAARLLKRLVLVWFCAVCLSCVSQAQGQIIIGTATFLDKKGDFPPNRQVVDGCRYIVIRTRDNVVYPAEVIEESSKFDLAVIRETGYVPELVVSLSVNPELYAYVPTPGMRLIYGGFDSADPKPDDPVDISNGEAVAGGEGVYFLHMRSGADHGSSGSGVFDDSGSMVGVIFPGYIDAYQHTTLENYYGYNVINFYNNNAVVEFLQKEMSPPISLAYSVDARTVIRTRSGAAIRLDCTRGVRTEAFALNSKRGNTLFNILVATLADTYGSPTKPRLCLCQ